MNGLPVITQRMLHAILFCRSPEGFWGLPILCWGDPGVGKTALIRQAARAVQLPFERLSPGERGEGAFGVVPMPGADGFLHYPAPDWVARFHEGGVLFLDEINLGGVGLQAPMLGLVQLRMIGTYALHERTRVLAAANDAEDSGGWDLVRALDNRFGHFTYEGMPVDDWIPAYMTRFDRDIGPTIDAKVEEARVMELWPEADDFARARVAGFIHRQRDHLHRKPEKGNPAKAFETRRSWEYAGVVLAAAKVHNLTAIERDGLMQGFIGAGPVSEFARWESEADLGDPQAIVDGTETFKHDKRRLDRSLAVLGSCASVVTNTKDAAQRKERARRCWEIIETVSEQSVSAVFPAAVRLARAGLVGGAAASKALEALYPMLAAAGITPKNK